MGVQFDRYPVWFPPQLQYNQVQIEKDKQNNSLFILM